MYGPQRRKHVATGKDEAFDTRRAPFCFTVTGPSGELHDGA
jgi:hypothetical protein